MTFKIRGGKYWRIFFWWDYKLPIKIMIKYPKLYLFFKYELRRLRYKIIIENHIMYEKDRFKFWKNKKDTGGRFY